MSSPFSMRLFLGSSEQIFTHPQIRAMKNNMATTLVQLSETMCFIGVIYKKKIGESIYMKQKDS